MLNEDYRDMLCALRDEGVRFVLVGAYALAAHGHVRATMDIDIWVMPAPDNAAAVLRALKRFGAPIEGLHPSDFELPGTVFQIGVAPRRIDILTSASGLDFEETFARAQRVEIDGISVRVPAIEDLLVNKRSTGRTQDLADAEALEAIAAFGPTDGKAG